VRSRLAANDQAALESVLIDASTEYENWINRRVKGRWEKGELSSGTPSPGSDLLRNVMGGFLAGKLTGRKSDEDR
jgi:hypothetical protein